MKFRIHHLLILITTLSAFSFMCMSWERTYLADGLSVTFPNTSYVSNSYNNDSSRIHALIEDSIECLAAIFIDKEYIEEDSINIIDGLDANLYKYIETQQGYDIKTEKTMVGTEQATQFQYKSAFLMLRDSSNHEGIMLYHKNYLVLIEVVVPTSVTDAMDKKKEKFLSSLWLD